MTPRGKLQMNPSSAQPSPRVTPKKWLAVRGGILDLHKVRMKGAISHLKIAATEA
jgi:hypothetical protein